MKTHRKIKSIARVVHRNVTNYADKKSLLRFPLIATIFLHDTLKKTVKKSYSKEILSFTRKNQILGDIDII